MKVSKLVRASLLCATVMSGSASRALAQDTAAAPQAVAPNAAQPATADVTSSGIQDIVVTANRTNETAQRSALSLEVLRGAVLDRVSRPQDLTTVTTGVQIGSTGPYPQIFIRGVGETARSSRTQGAVPFSVDGVFLPRGVQATTNFFDVSRIEVLKGPQGTLYGRNATGGVINILTNKPQLGVNSVIVNGEIGNFNLYGGDAAINVAIAPTIAVRASGQVIRRDGYLSDGGQDQKTEAGRIRVLWEPSPDVQLVLNGDMSHIGGQGSGVVVLPVQNGNPWRSNTQTPLTYAFTLAPPFTQVNDRFIDSKIWGTSAELTADLGFASLTVIPAYRHQDQAYLSYNTNFRFVEVLEDEQTTVEARLSNEGDRLKWVIGGFFLDQNSRADSYLTNAGARDANRVFDKRNAVAAFGTATLAVIDHLRVTGGLRYTREKYQGSYNFGSGAYPLFPYVENPATETSVPKVTTNRVNWKAGLEYDLSRTSLLFANASTGFRAGGFDNTPGTSTCSGFQQYKPEKVTAYTVGSKNRFLNNALQVNVEGFYWKLNNQQFVGQQPNACGITFNYTFNAGDANIKGVSLDAVWRLTERDTLGVAVEYLDGTYHNFSFTSVGLGAYAPAARSRCSTAPGSVTGQFIINCNGLPVIRSPKWSGKANYEHSFMLDNGGKISPSVDVQWATSRWLDLAYGPNGHVPSYALTNAELRYTAPGGNFSIALWMQNIFNEEVYTSGTNISRNAPDGTRFYTATIQPPRSYGMRVHTSF